ncbi:hypothetical protein [Pedobacter frigoris]|uniref:hypothetical protein n=1 Tax=Pedobacter frigoris TaxID=2571272 RepID=UPI00292D4C9E|nr:hypothetical protein [Pedobacter frigoris]
MAQQPFTEEGVSLKIAELYDLSDPALQLQADAAKANFRGWLQNQFILDTDQVGYLNNISNDWINDTGGQFSIALSYRLPISLIRPVRIDPNDFSSKICRTDSTVLLEYNSLTGIAASGTFSVQLFVP